MSDHHKRAVSGALIGALQSIGEKLITLLFIAYLARVLPVSEFGKVTILMVFVEVGMSFSCAGIGSSLITNQNLKPIDLNTAFTTSWIIAFLLPLLLFHFSPFILGFFDLSNSFFLFLIILFFLFTQILQTPVRALLSKNMHFKTLSSVSIVSTLCSALTCMFLSFSPLKDLTLAIFYFLQSFFILLGCYFLSPHRFCWEFSKDSFKKMAKLSTPTSFAAVVQMASDKVVPLALGRFAGTDILGVYSLAIRPCGIIWQVFSSSMLRIVLPLRSSSLSTSSLTDFLGFSLRPVIVFVFPPLIFITLNSSGLLLLLYGKLMPGAAEVLAVSALSLLSLTLGYMGDSVFLTSSRSYVFLLFSLFRFFSLLLALYFAVPHGIVGVAFGQLICNFMLTLLIYFSFLGLLKVSALDLFSRIRMLLLQAICFIFVYSLFFVLFYLYFKACFLINLFCFFTLFYFYLCVLAGCRFFCSPLLFYKKLNDFFVTP